MDRSSRLRCRHGCRMSCVPTPTTRRPASSRCPRIALPSSKQVAKHYKGLFGSDPELSTLRAQYAIAENPIPDPARRDAMVAILLLDVVGDASRVAPTTRSPTRATGRRSRSSATCPTDADVHVDVHQYPRDAAAASARLVWYLCADASATKTHPVVPESDPLRRWSPRRR